ncbi:MAG: hypothetical protein Q9227_006544 [Pyrenula ochraceoflavens]
MATRVAKRDTGRARSGLDRPDQHLVAAGRSSRKRHRSPKNEDEEEHAAGHQRKSRRIQGSPNRPSYYAPPESARPSRRSPRFNRKQPTKSQETIKRGKTRPSHPRDEGVKQDPKEDEYQFKTSLKRLGVPAKRRRDEEQRAVLEVKRLRRSLAPTIEARTGPDKEGSIENWLEESSWSRKTSAEHQPELPEAVIKMPRRAAAVLPSPDNSFESATTTSGKSEKSTANVHDTDYRQSLRYRNIYIERENPPPELMRRAQRIISRLRTSPELDDSTIDELKRTSRRLQDDAEDKIIKQLVPDIVPATKTLPDQRLEMNANQRWFNSIPVPLDVSILTNPIPLPKPKPDLAFGYSETAFTRNQLGTIDLLVDDQFGRSYVFPDQKLRFPFLNIECKSQAKNGTHYIATNQAAGAGAIALNGNMDLIQRSVGMEKFDHDEPHFFSVTMDHELARVNVHWLRAPPQGEQCSFHTEGLSKHLLDDANGIRAVIRAIKNILDWGADSRLRALCKALDAYREIVVRNREAANAQARQGHNILSAPQIARQTRGMAQPVEPGVGRNTTLHQSPVALQIERQPHREETLGRDVREAIPTTAIPQISRQSATVTTTAGASLTYGYEDTVISRHPIPGAQPEHSSSGTRQTRRQIRPTQKVLENANASGSRDRRR